MTVALSTTRFEDGQAEVRGVDTDGLVVRALLVSERSDGWWPDSYVECITNSTDTDTGQAARFGLGLVECPSGRASSTSGGFLVETPTGTRPGNKRLMRGSQGPASTAGPSKSPRTETTH